MQKIKRYLTEALLLLGVLLLISSTAVAEEVGMVTGSQQGTYFKFGQEIADKAKAAGLNITVKESEGSLDNINRMLSKENAAFAIVQSDVLSYLKRSSDPELQAVSKRLRLVFPFYNEEVHLFARKDIKQLQDLQGKKVVLGKEKSGNWLTGSNLLAMAGIKPAEILYLPPPDAVTAVLKGDADAMVYVAGKPVTLFSNLSNLKSNAQLAALLDQVHFVPLTDQRLLQTYGSSSIGSTDYSWFSGQIPTVAVKAALISFDFSSAKNPYFKQRCEQLATLGQVIYSSIDELRKSGHPKWKEVDLGSQIVNWQLDSCSRRKIINTGDKTMDQRIKCAITGKCP